MRETHNYTIQYNNSSTKRMTMFGAIGGVIGGLIMAPFIMLTALLVDMPPDTMPTAIAQAFVCSSRKCKQVEDIWNQQQIMGMLQQNMPTMIGMGVLEHLVYGAVLGAITTALVLKVNPNRREQSQQKREEK